ncbi:MAG: YidC/Oxa1 family membrane protein insertase [Erysipelotrichaceae bacterium]|nr:YidC/Oxa1 family membrane protein insertase [Erysipelotrichaceae bacterium]
MLTFIYNVIIGPLKLLFEVVFSAGSILTNSAGFGIMFLSLVLNILLLPLYKKADEIQDKEKQIQNEMKEDIDFIKKTFKGNEQFLILQTYYRQHDYKPVYSLRSSISLLLQIPFFIAAYDFLSNLELLKGLAFGPISDLGRPDVLFFGINVLPVLMTAINVVSTIVYTKGQPFKQKIQLYIMALFFLVLLYNAPAALSFYYLLNNVFSLLKNSLNKSKYKNQIISVLATIISFLLIYVIATSDVLGNKTKIIGLLFFAFIILTSIYKFFNRTIPSIKVNIITENNKCFLACSIFMCVLVGLLIPSTVINASPEEFIIRTDLINPNEYIFSAFSLSIGLFVVWLNVYYLLTDSKYKGLIDVLFFAVCLISLVNYLIFNTGFGNLSSTLRYDEMPFIDLIKCTINLFCIFMIIVILFFGWKKISKQSSAIAVIASVAMIIMSSMNMVNINNVYIEGKKRIESNSWDGQIIHFSENERNIVVIMLDRAISMYVPYILNETSELQEQFSGFTFFPNAISFGATTNIGTPGLFGGYEYTPEEINKRSDELLVDKQNEALKVMPVLFDNNEFDVVVCDPPYANYKWIPDLSVFDEYEGIKAYNTEGAFSEKFDTSLDALNRNLFLYSVSKITPSVFHNAIYNCGNYLSADYCLDSVTRISTIDPDFINSYQALSHLIDMSFIGNEKGLFLMLQNGITHEPILLQEPEYLPDEYVDNSEYLENDTYKYSIFGDTLEIINQTQLEHYHVNIKAFMELGKWFDFLKKEGVYDNTRIIIVSDHGFPLYLNEDLITSFDDVMSFNALLMVKDYNSKEFSVDNSFMTVADVPYLATEEIIEKPVNVFTGKEIEKMEKENTVFNVFASRIHDTNVNNGTQFIEDKWYSVHDNCLDTENWKEIEDPSNE